MHKIPVIKHIYLMTNFFAKTANYVTEAEMLIKMSYFTVTTNIIFLVRMPREKCIHSNPVITNHLREPKKKAYAGPLKRGHCVHRFSLAVLKKVIMY